MILYDKLLMETGDKIIEPFDEKQIQNICYDITTETFSNEKDTEVSYINLEPGKSTFVKAKESIKLPPNIIGKVILRNSRIRQGLSLDAPIYQPGHHTKIFYRITNVSGQVIRLDDTSEIASIMLEALDGDVDKPYEGAYQKEFDYRGMGDYSSILSRDMTIVDEKLEDVKSVERTIYGNVLAIMAVFVGVFSLININISNASMGMMELITLDLTTVGSVAVLVAIINATMPKAKNIAVLWVASIIAFAVAIVIQFL